MAELWEDPVFLAQLSRAVIVVLAAFVVTQVFSRFLIRVAERGLGLPKGRLVSASRLFSLIVWTIAGVILLATFQVDVTALLAGLGIGALIIGFALKDILENWIAGILVLGGRTFRKGDVIRVDNLTGRVTDISLRTTTLKTYDRNEILIPNSTLLRSNIINLTGGKTETIASLTFTVDYTFPAEEVESVIDGVLRKHPNVIVDEPRREIRFVVRIREWTMEIEALFWINEPDQEEFIKSRVAEKVKREFEAAGVLPPVPVTLRQQYMEPKTIRRQG